MLRRLMSSPALFVTLLSGSAGVAFSAGNLILAGILPKESFARVALCVTLINLGYPLATVGTDSVLIRRSLPLSRRLMGWALLPASAVALIATLASALIYELGPALDSFVFFGVLCGGLTQLMAAEFQKREQFPLAILLSQGTAFFLLLGSLAVLAWPGGGVILVMVTFVSGFAISGAVSWKHTVSRLPANNSFPIREAVSLAGTAAATMVLLNVERLTIPRLLGLTELANFMVLAALVLGPFRTLQLGVAKTVLPRMANANEARERWLILRDEAVIVSVVALFGSIALWFLTEPVVELLYDDRYPAPKGLIVALVVSGWSKVAGGFANASVTAVGSNTIVARWNALGWICVALSFAGAAVGATWGLAGLTYGVAVGWAARAVLGALMTLPYVREPSTVAERGD